MIERARRLEFEKRVDAYKVRLFAHSEGMRKTLAEEAGAIINDAVNLIAERMARSVVAKPLQEDDLEMIAEGLHTSLGRAESESPKVNLVFKEVTYEQTQDNAFKDKLDKALPSLVKRRLGGWYENFTAAKQAASQSKEPQR
ncbi:hypothetical protein [uncultured Thiocystis sp.]|jgi:hypothetical protein|uniref:hypothetical protein n=1 Tax=uncultured Thiocystis sp. TaxID=1202134 RepID=UPI0025E9B2E3|nr:hypothetical protein [uncultured Thiocystis sp.]